MIIAKGYHPFSSIWGLLIFKKNIYFIIFCIWVFCLYVCAAHVCSALECQKRASNFLKLEWQIVVTSIQVWGLESRISGRVARALNNWAISPAPPSFFLRLLFFFYSFCEPDSHMVHTDLELSMKLKLASNFWPFCHLTFQVLAL